MGDVGVVLEFGRVVVHVSHGHEHAGGTGESPGKAPIAGHHHQGVVLPGLPIEEGTGDDLPRGRVDGELWIATREPIAVWEENKGRKTGLVFQKAAWCLKMITIFYTLQTTMLSDFFLTVHLSSLFYFFKFQGLS